MVTDVLIIGSGGAGLSASIKAKEYTNNVLVVSKTLPTQAQTSQAQGGINASIDEDITTHIEDTYKYSCSIANKETISYMCHNSFGAIEFLDSIGVPFSKDEKRCMHISEAK